MPLRVVTWNVNSLRSALRHGFLDWLTESRYDVICLQEVRAELKYLLPLESLFKGYKAYWNPAVKPGYAGVGILTRYEPVSIERGLNGGEDPEGRSITADFGTFRVGSFYAPNATPNTMKIPKKLLWLNDFQEHIAARNDKPFLVTGDLNVAHTTLDSQGIDRPQGMNGCTPEERAGFQSVLDHCLLSDPTRERSGDKILSTWWNPRDHYRAAADGVRYDYILLQKKFNLLVEAQAIHPEVTGSDHCPVSMEIGLFVESLTLAQEAGQKSLL
jgi:exodeoxyribonuclease-3